MGSIKKITKKQSLAFFERILKCIRKQKKGYFLLRKLRGAHGYCAWDEGILVDYRKEFIPTIIHEVIHLLEPDWSEAQVIYVEKRVVNAISEQDVIDLLKFFTRKL